MQEVTGLVSIIIPAFNAAEFLPETILSVKKQTYSGWEIIVVNDGSSDATASLVKKEADPQFHLIEQDNAGVSAARNKGLQQASGEFVVFLDSDDLLSPSFLETRVDFLNQNHEFGFAGGDVETFPVTSGLKKATAENPEKEILFFDSSCATVPSNYMFRKKIIDESGVRFNTNLSSTADRFFILQISRYTKGKYLGGKNGRLLYRINERSMSHNISPALILDNEQFYKELVKENMLPVVNMAKFKSQYFYSLGIGFAMIKYLRPFVKYMLYSLVASPACFTQLIGRKLSDFLKKKG